MKSYLVLLTLCCALFNCKKSEKQVDNSPKEDTELKALFALMQGSFNSQLQAEADST